MKRMTPAEAAEWRRKSVERYRAKRGVPTLCSAGTFIRDDLHEAVECVLRARHLGEHKGETSSGAVWWTDEHLEWDPFHSNYRSAAPSRQKHLSRAKKLVTPQRARKQAEDAEYRRNREMRLVRARGRCEWVLPDRGVFGRGTPAPCYSVATQTHHLMRRSHHVDHGVENLRALCAIHHAWLHANVEWAKENGWIRTEWDKIGETPMER